MKKFISILYNVLPILLMIVLIPLISNDYWLMIVYVIIIISALLIKHEPKDFLIFSFGFVFMILSEYLFISTGVETFVRHSLLGLMPVWLPFLGGYGFIVIGRSAEILKK